MKTKAPSRVGSSIEFVEPRIAPASLTFADVDGDMVHVTVSGAASGFVAEEIVLIDPLLNGAVNLTAGLHNDTGVILDDAGSLGGVYSEGRV